MNSATRCLLVHPEFTSRSFWNYRATCDLVGAKYPAAPLGLITVAALLPESWQCRLVDCNVETLRDADLDWAEIVFIGGMIAQQVSALELIRRCRKQGKTVVIGGPDATSSPHLYDEADHLVLGEAEVTLPRFLEDLQRGSAAHLYAAGDEKADVAQSPRPRFDLLDFGRYLHVGVQFARGCPFSCEFCDIIELFGRVPRLKSTEQMLAELDALYELGYRGHVDFVDDNFIGNKRDLRKFLPELKRWQEEHRWPFEFTTEASINLADDERLLEMMRAVGFTAIFVGVESPDEDTLKQISKGQNTKRDLATSLKKIYSYGIFVNTGYILGFDQESGTVADGVLALIETSAVPVNMVGLLHALPSTQLTRRLAREGRLDQNFDFVDGEASHGDQCTGGLNFRTKRPRSEILRDYRRIIVESYAPRAYFDRVVRMSTALDCRGRKLNLPPRYLLRELKGFSRLIWRMGVIARYRFLFWGTLARIAWRNPRALRSGIATMALYLHLGEFGRYLGDRLQANIVAAEAQADDEQSAVLDPAVAEA